jgi:uncharacterized membrane protein
MDGATFVMGFAAALGSALIAGMFYAFSSFVMRALARLAPAEGVGAMNSINVTVITPSFMLVFVGTALLCVALAAMSLIAWQLPGSALMLAASLLYAGGTFGLTMAVNQPMNLRLGAMQPGEVSAYWPLYVRSWTIWNHTRTAAALLASGLFIAALALQLSAHQPATLQ